MSENLLLGRLNTILYCCRFQECVDFYERVLGLAVMHRRDWFVEFRVGNDAFISVADEARCTVASSGGAGVTLSLRATDLDTLRERLLAAGFEPTPVRPQWQAVSFFCHDPEGNRLEFWGPRVRPANVQS